VAEFLGTIHHEFTFTVQDGLDALEDLIWHLESVEQARAGCAALSLIAYRWALGSFKRLAIHFAVRQCDLSGHPIPRRPLAWDKHRMQSWNAYPLHG
jgi:hypothetical protein